MDFLIWIATGLVAGWLAGLLMKGRDYGLTGNIILGLLGGTVGGWLLRLFGFAGPKTVLPQLVVSLFGAMLVLGVARRLRPVTRQGKAVLGKAVSIADVTQQLHRLSEFEKRAVERLRGRTVQTRNPNEVFEQQLTFGQRIADRVAVFGGSWTFIGTFLLIMLVWMIWNTETAQRFDPFPFILLNLVLSCLAALQAPVIMMSQNRQAAKDRLDARTDFEVNVRSEAEISRLHAKFDELREREWVDLVEMQKRQIVLLEDALRRLGGAAPEPGTGTSA